MGHAPVWCRYLRRVAGMDIQTGAGGFARDMAKEAADDLESVPTLLAVAFYIIGAAIVGFGLLKLKRHVDHPQQTTIGSGLIAILIGVSLIAVPAVINALGDTLGLSGGSHTVIKPRL